MGKLYTLHIVRGVLVFPVILLDYVVHKVCLCALCHTESPTTTSHLPH
jgi:hypothetical protein